MPDIIPAPAPRQNKRQSTWPLDITPAPAPAPVTLPATPAMDPFAASRQTPAQREKIREARQMAINARKGRVAQARDFEISYHPLNHVVYSNTRIL